MADERTPDAADDHPRERRGHMVRVLGLAGWGIVLALVSAAAIREPGTPTIAVAVAFYLLFALVHVQLLLLRWLGHRHWRRINSKLHGSAYLSEFHALPNRNYLLAEIRREMPRARGRQAPFVLLQFSLDDIEGVRERRGAEFADRAVNALADTLKRLTRNSDFLAHLGGARFCSMLVDCTAEQSTIFLQRVPGSVAVSDGHRMLDVTITARVYEYDLEALYATDVLLAVEAVRPLRRREEPRFDAVAA